MSDCEPGRRNMQALYEIELSWGNGVVDLGKLQRIQRKRTKGWRMPENTVYVGRGSRWGNPFQVYNGHTIMGPSWSDARDNWGRVTAANVTNAYITSSKLMGPADTLGHFEMLMRVRRRDEAERFERWIRPLRGNNLACWCPESQPCHGDVLLELANGGMRRV